MGTIGGRRGCGSLVGGSVQPMSRLWTLALLLPLAACSNYQDQLERAELHYRAARYEYALTNLEDLEPDLARLDDRERVRYHFVRGMTHARLQQRHHARHWLALTRELSAGSTVLGNDALASMRRVLTETENFPSASASASADAGAPSR